VASLRGENVEVTAVLQASTADFMGAIDSGRVTEVIDVARHCVIGDRTVVLLPSVDLWAFARR
jgi:hypothetical protein